MSPAPGRLRGHEPTMRQSMVRCLWCTRIPPHFVMAVEKIGSHRDGRIHTEHEHQERGHSDPPPTPSPDDEADDKPESGKRVHEWLGLVVGTLSHSSSEILYR